MERKFITSTEREKVKFDPPKGAVMFIRDPEGRILYISESEDKPETGKVAGEYSVNCETSKDGEDWTETVPRGLKEELGLTDQDIEETLNIRLNGGYLGETEFTEGVRAHVVVLDCDDPDELLERIKPVDEIKVEGWIEPDLLLSQPVRSGVGNVLRRVLSGGWLGSLSQPRSLAITDRSLRQLAQDSE
ncbi:NUDIX hydrolase [Candidatus Woesebacteria bacterium]|nr:NUDIX hydrolase [Candidatus Woesebacteria bacterium]